MCEEYTSERVGEVYSDYVYVWGVGGGGGGFFFFKQKTAYEITR